MKWERKGDNLIVSDTVPAYTVARFTVDGKRLYRASYQREFIGQVENTAKGAQAICQRHHTINQEAQEA